MNNFNATQGSKFDFDTEEVARMSPKSIKYFHVIQCDISIIYSRAVMATPQEIEQVIFQFSQNSTVKKNTKSVNAAHLI